VIPYDATNEEEANGFGFVTPAPYDLFMSTWIGMLNYRETRPWKQLQANGMSADFSWDRSAHDYDRVYRRAMGA